MGQDRIEGDRKIGPLTVHSGPRKKSPWFVKYSDKLCYGTLALVILRMFDLVPGKVHGKWEWMGKTFGIETAAAEASNQPTAGVAKGSSDDTFTWDIGAMKLSCIPQADDTLRCAPKPDPEDSPVLRAAGPKPADGPDGRP